MSDEVDVETVVVGAGVVGLAVARALAQTGREVVVIEREAGIGRGTSGRNSGVIHAGIYYPAGSLKARLCVRGNDLLYRFCAQHSIAHARLGKLIVATTEEDIRQLEAYERSARANGVMDLERLDRARVAELEPEVVALAALHSPSTGIVDAQGLMQALEAELTAAGGRVVPRTTLERAIAEDGRFLLRLASETGSPLSCRELVNAAGLQAPELARRIEGIDSSTLPVARFARGHYFSLAGPKPFQRLIYPVASGGGLGIHATLDLAGQVRFGPDVEWIDQIDYGFSTDLVPRFAAAIRRYYPSLEEGRLAPDYTGIRPKIYGPTDPVANFRIDGPTVHGVAGLVNLLGIESPGLTASLAIGEHVAAILSG